ncbi:MAG: insulinase family protein [Clostridiales bacterium]|nr:insulinase family protein [Clostridiales bacterium]
MKIKEYRNEKLAESYSEIEHPSGLKILVMPKPGYSTTYALFAARYGSIDTHIQAPDGSYYEIPDGTAHFLEHKLFESDEQDAFERFAKTGASANAFTSFDRTAYLFSCSTNVKQNLEILMDFVQSPYFTQQTVDKEQGIIGQEIRMYKDSPDWSLMINLLQALYSNSPVFDVAGTEESIAKITAETLYDCYRNFYDLNNMVFAVAGNTTVEEVLEVADRMLKPAKGKKAQRKLPDSKNDIKSYVEEKMSVETTQFMFGFRENNGKPEVSTLERVASSVILDVIAGNASACYKELMEEELINTSFSYEYLDGFGYAVPIFVGESNDPKLVSEKIRKYISELKKTGIDPKAFERSRRKLYGRMVMEYNDVENIADALVVSYFRGEGLFDEITVCAGLTLEQVNERLRAMFDEESYSLSVVLPKG